MKNWIRRFLGIDELITNQHLLDARTASMQLRLNTLSKIEGQIIAANRGMGRLISKLDPMYGRDELDPARKAESDKLGEEIIRKLIAEHIESNRMNPNV